nr:MAG TPA_asm: hypothetical protein [Caudoviricetes sp.]
MCLLCIKVSMLTLNKKSIYLNWKRLNSFRVGLFFKR